MRIILGAVLAGVALTACAPPQPITATPTTIQHECRLGVRGEADRVCDPGSVNLEVTQDNIHQTICDPVWLEHERPPTRYTTPIKREEMARYGLTDAMNHYRLDHIVALGIGGAPKDPRNLYPQPVAESVEKDRLERQLHTDVCAGRVLLVDAQDRMRLIWTI